MFGVGAGELVIILVLALLFLGPSRLPRAASDLGRAVRAFRRALRGAADRVEIEPEIARPLRELQAAVRDEPARAQVAHVAGEAKVAAVAAVAARRRDPDPQG